MNKGVFSCSCPDANYIMHSAFKTSVTAVQAVCGTYHGIVAEFVHEVRRLVAFIVVEPHGALELIPGVQQKHVPLSLPDLFDLGETPGHAGKAAALRALARVLVGLLDARVHIVGVQKRELPVCRHETPARAQQQQQKRERERRAPVASQVAHSVASLGVGSEGACNA